MTLTTGGSGWVCCHLGAREHYAVPRALHRQGRLRLMVTDAWVRPGSPLRLLPARVPRRLAERYHPELADARIHDLTFSLLVQEARWRLQQAQGWDLLIGRNQWFQRRAVEVLSGYLGMPNEPVVVFAHAYSACRIFRLAKARGWITVLGQIDPGEEHWAIVRCLANSAPEYGPAPPAPPASYFDSWREECALADRIVVNSDWSRAAVVRAGVSAEKLRVVPLAYEPEGTAGGGSREFPEAFTPARPLRVLFAGSVSVVKGAPSLLAAIAQLQDAPITLRIVGEPAMAVPEGFAMHRSIEWVGAVSRSEIMRHYRECDVLVFASHSDGFGMAQVEALANGLPVIASPFCGRVVEDGVNGIVLSEVSAPAIVAALRTILARPSLLAGFARGVAASTPTGVTALGTALLQLAP